ncbi:hypothetical protein CHUAL_004218 [Chamberlinius hualienensis]
MEKLMETLTVFLFIGFCAISSDAAGITTPNVEDEFKNIHKMDDQECIPRLLCELAILSQKKMLSTEESTILAVFSNQKSSGDKNIKSDARSPLTLYKTATDIGKFGKDEGRCQTNFSKCPLTGTDLMLAFKNIVIKS